MRTNGELVDHIRDRARNYLDARDRSPGVLSALRALDRAAFLPAEVRSLAYEDTPLSIGEGQTCSQPSMVAFMLDQLDLKPGLRVLEIGAGCGYAAAAACLLVRPGGQVFAAEILSDLAFRLRTNAAGFPELIPLEGDGLVFAQTMGPFDRIFLSAGVVPGSTKVGETLLGQLRTKGILLYPETRGVLTRFHKVGAGLERRTFPGVSFVPLRGQSSESGSTAI